MSSTNVDRQQLFVNLASFIIDEIRLPYHSKIRCDGTLPVCSTCARLGRLCDYQKVSDFDNQLSRERKRRGKERKAARLAALATYGHHEIPEFIDDDDAQQQRKHMRLTPSPGAQHLDDEATIQSGSFRNRRRGATFGGFTSLDFLRKTQALADDVAELRDQPYPPIACSQPSTPGYLYDIKASSSEQLQLHSSTVAGAVGGIGIAPRSGLVSSPDATSGFANGDTSLPIAPSSAPACPIDLPSPYGQYGATNLGHHPAQGSFSLPLSSSSSAAAAADGALARMPKIDVAIATFLQRVVNQRTMEAEGEDEQESVVGRMDLSEGMQGQLWWQQQQQQQGGFPGQQPLAHSADGKLPVQSATNLPPGSHHQQLIAANSQGGGRNAYVDEVNLLGVDFAGHGLRAGWTTSCSSTSSSDGSWAPPTDPGTSYLSASDHSSAAFRIQPPLNSYYANVRGAVSSVSMPSNGFAHFRSPPPSSGSSGVAMSWQGSANPFFPSDVEALSSPNSAPIDAPAAAWDQEAEENLQHQFFSPDMSILTTPGILDAAPPMTSGTSSAQGVQQGGWRPPTTEDRPQTALDVLSLAGTNSTAPVGTLTSSPDDGYVFSLAGATAARRLC